MVEKVGEDRRVRVQEISVRQHHKGFHDGGNDCEIGVPANGFCGGEGKGILWVLVTGLATCDAAAGLLRTAVLLSRRARFRVIPMVGTEREAGGYLGWGYCSEHQQFWVGSNRGRERQRVDIE